METEPGLKNFLEPQESGHCSYLWADAVPEGGAVTEKEHLVGPTRSSHFQLTNDMEIITAQSSQNTFHDFFLLLRFGHFDGSV